MIVVGCEGMQVLFCHKAEGQLSKIFENVKAGSAFSGGGGDAPGVAVPRRVTRGGVDLRDDGAALEELAVRGHRAGPVAAEQLVRGLGLRDHREERHRIALDPIGQQDV